MTNGKPQTRGYWTFALLSAFTLTLTASPLYASYIGPRFAELFA